MRRHGAQAKHNRVPYNLLFQRNLLLRSKYSQPRGDTNATSLMFAENVHFYTVMVSICCVEVLGRASLLCGRFSVFFSHGNLGRYSSAGCGTRISPWKIASRVTPRALVAVFPMRIDGALVSVVL